MILTESSSPGSSGLTLSRGALISLSLAALIVACGHARAIQEGLASLERRLAGRPVVLDSSAARTLARAISTYLDTLERRTYDGRLELRARLHPVPLDDRPVLVGIDDAAIHRYGRWPWDRDRVARMIETLRELGAAGVFLDIEFPEPSSGEDGPARDEHLARALEPAEGADPLNGFRSFGVMYFDPDLRTIGGEELAAPLAPLIARLEPDPGIDFASLLEQRPALVDPPWPLEAGAAWLPGQDVLTAVRSLATAGNDFDSAMVMQRLGLPLAEGTREIQQQVEQIRQFVLAVGLAKLDALEKQVEDARGLVLEKKVLHLLEERPELSPAEALEMLRVDLAEHGVLIAQQLEDIVPRSVSLHRLGRRLAPTLAGIRPDQLEAFGHLVPPIPPIARGYGGVGSSVTQRDADGVQRRQALLFRLSPEDSPWFGAKNPDDLRFILHPALLMAARIHGVEPRDFRLEDGWLTLPDAGGSGRWAVAPVDDKGQVLIDYRGKWGHDGIPRIGAESVLELHELKEVERDFLRRDAAYGAWVKIQDMVRFPPIEAGLPGARSCLDQALLSGIDEVARAELVRRRIQIEERLQKDSGAVIRGLLRARESKRPDAMRVALEYLERLRTATRVLKTDMPAQREELRRIVEGRFCLVGLTATGTTDISVSPLESRYVNLGVHATVLNQILSRSTLRQASWIRFEVPLVIFYALLVPVLIVRRHIRWAAVLLGAFIALHLLAAAVLLVYLGLWIPLAIPISVALASYVLLNIILLLRTTTFKNRLQAELDVARSIQRSMMPVKELGPGSERKVKICGDLLPAREVGGDFYDYFLQEGRYLYFSIGDVSGKGIPAALFMAMTQTLLRTEASRTRSPAELLTRVNSSLAEDNESAMFVTIWLAVLDLEDRSMRYSNAGHNPPYLLEASDPQLLSRRHGPVAGAMEGFEYSEDVMTLTPGARLILYTDGVTEATSRRHELYGDARLRGLLKTEGRRPMANLVKHLLDSVVSFQAGVELADDVTLLVLDLEVKNDG